MGQHVRVGAMVASRTLHMVLACVISSLLSLDSTELVLFAYTVCTATVLYGCTAAGNSQK